MICVLVCPSLTTFHVYVKSVDLSDGHFMSDVVISFVLENAVGF